MNRMTTSAGKEPNELNDPLGSDSRRSFVSAFRRQSGIDALALRQWLVIAIGRRQRLGRKAKIAISILIFAVSFSVKSLQAVDVQQYMYTPDEPARGMSEQYDREAAMIDSGRGLLFPAGWDPSDTSLLVHAPGYPILLAGIYAISNRSYFYVQLVQNLLNSLSPVIIFLLAGELISWRK